MEQHFWTEESKFVLFGSTDDPQTLTLSQSTLKTVEHGRESIMIWGWCRVNLAYLYYRKKQQQEKEYSLEQLNN